MTKKKSSWDDIPSLDGLSVDWKFEPENPEGKRAHKRMINGELCPVLNMQSIPVRVAVKSEVLDGHLVDLTIAGMAVILKRKLVENSPVRVGFFLGQKKIVSNATVKHVKRIGAKYIVGIAYVDLKSEHQEFIQGLSAAKISSK